MEVKVWKSESERVRERKRERGFEEEDDEERGKVVVYFEASVLRVRNDR